MLKSPDCNHRSPLSDEDRPSKRLAQHTQPISSTSFIPSSDDPEKTATAAAAATAFEPFASSSFRDGDGRGGQEENMRLASILQRLFRKPKTQDGVDSLTTNVCSLMIANQLDVVITLSFFKALTGDTMTSSPLISISSPQILYGIAAELEQVVEQGLRLLARKKAYKPKRAKAIFRIACPLESKVCWTDPTTMQGWFCSVCLLSGDMASLTVGYQSDE